MMIYLFDEPLQARILHRLLHNRVEEHVCRRIFCKKMLSHMTSQQNDMHWRQPEKKGTQTVLCTPLKYKRRAKRTSFAD